MADELDLSRLAELRELLDSELPEIVETLVEELTRALEALTAALAAATWPRPPSPLTPRATAL